ncbi:unnamed protein product [Toxocara canis]|uniref:Tr-type G domain-containing protein n=1 Tax=Toxocara canis TaxID=6265 RepID=A0A183V7N1_TOXCA|nr:unnamed protein product [Toxocara canis]
MCGRSVAWKEFAKCLYTQAFEVIDLVIVSKCQAPGGKPGINVEMQAGRTETAGHFVERASEHNVTLQLMRCSSMT